ncbi:MAG: ABC transporter permease [Chloroflexi bacterium]|nr:ABC transporter permease [Chloroflexota bacterium]
MQAYIIKRFLQGIIVILGVSVVVFVLIRLTGDPVSLMLPEDASLQDIQRIRKVLGLDEPIHIQYLKFISGAVRGDFGMSLHHEQPVTKLIFERVPATLELAGGALLLSIFIGLPLGVLAALKRRTALDGLVMLGALVGQSAPSFWIGIIFILFFGVQLRWLPVAGRGSIQHLILPAFTAGFFSMALYARLTRSTMLDVLIQDYIKTARAKGLKEIWVVTKHALRNCLIPVVTVIGLSIGHLLGGIFIIEMVFAWPGMGRLAVMAIYSLDYPIVQGVVFMVSTLYVFINLGVDILYAYLNPQIRYA